jgi:glycosyltransferase involved in cell wall biosynthesis
VICHSTLEVERYSQLFAKTNAKFVYVPYGLHIDEREEYLTDSSDHELKENTYILTAGRSGRDYRSLFEAVSTLGTQLRVICDNENALSHLSIPPNVNILRNCYDEDYIMQIKNAAMVVIPLGASDISAGQMVLIQAMALAKPVIITRTPTVENYVSDGVDAILVKKNSPEELRKAINEVLADDQLRGRLSKNALETYEQKFSMNAFVANLVNQIRDIN